MYGFDWIERLRRAGRGSAGPRTAYRPGPVVLALGLTSLLTDVSSEMVSSLLPVYLVLHLRMSPLEYGAVDGFYNGFATVLVGLAAGWLADRTRSHKAVATAGYGLSAVCKLLLVAAGGVWGYLLLATGLDRLGKGLRSPPRDALISLHTAPEHYAAAFGVHRAMDAVGALAGPLAGFALLWLLPGQFASLWMISFIFAVLGVLAIVLLVPSNSHNATAAAAGFRTSAALRWVSGEAGRRFRWLALGSLLLAATTVSDGFTYLLLQRKSGIAGGYLPLFAVGTAAGYMLLAMPFGLFGDRFGRLPLWFGGFAVLAGVYLWLAYAPSLSGIDVGLALLAMGAFYACTEGVMIALCSAELPAEYRTVGLALLGSAIGAGKFCSSVAFGSLWESHGEQVALVTFVAGLAMAAALTAVVLGRARNE